MIRPIRSPDELHSAELLSLRRQEGVGRVEGAVGSNEEGMAWKGREWLVRKRRE